MARKRFTDKDRARIFAANNGCCHLCNGKIDGVREKWEIEHVIAWELTRDDSDENLRPAHIDCHKDKTHKHDRPAINQAKRREAKYQGVKRSTGRLQGPGFQKSTKTPRADIAERQIAELQAELDRIRYERGLYCLAKQAAEAHNARLSEALEPFALISSEGVVKIEEGHVTVTTCAEYFHRARAARRLYEKEDGRG